MNGEIRIRHIYKATELKRFHKLEGKYHHMGKTHSGGDTMRIVFEDIRARRCDENVTGALMLARAIALYFFAKSGMSNCQAFKEKIQANPDMAFDLVMGKEV